MNTRPKTSTRLTMAALSLAVALALPTGPASAQLILHDEPVDEESAGLPDDGNGTWVWCFPLYWWLIYCGTR